MVVGMNKSITQKFVEVMQMFSTRNLKLALVTENLPIRNAIMLLHAW